MKKTYMIPSVKEVKVRMEQHVCAGSPTTPDFDNGDHDLGNGGNFGKDDLDTDTWGW